MSTEDTNVAERTQRPNGNCYRELFDVRLKYWSANLELRPHRDPVIELSNSVFAQPNSADLVRVHGSRMNGRLFVDEQGELAQGSFSEPFFVVRSGQGDFSSTEIAVGGVPERMFLLVHDGVAARIQSIETFRLLGRDDLVVSYERYSARPPVNDECG